MTNNNSNIWEDQLPYLNFNLLESHVSLVITLAKFLEEEPLLEVEWECTLKDSKNLSNSHQYMEEVKKLWLI